MSDKMMEDFEIWGKGFGLIVARFGNGYDIPTTNSAWNAWQASRQALVVELPPQHEYVIDGFDSSELIFALKQTGIKWKE